jgi:hypothetical protein
MSTGLSSSFDVTSTRDSPYDRPMVMHLLLLDWGVDRFLRIVWTVLPVASVVVM